MKKFPRILRLRIFLQIFTYSLLATTLSLTASAANNLVHRQVIDVAENYVLSNLQQFNDGDISVNAMQLDSRLEVPNCPKGFQASSSEEALRQSNVTVKITCDEPNWYIYLVVKAVQMQPVVVLTDTLSPGSLLTKANVKVVEMDKKLLRTSTFADIETVIGARIKRRTRPGQPIVPNQLCFVCKGDSIVITANAGGVDIKTNGIAQQDGNLGETIAVKNSNSRKMIHAKVVSAKKVVVHI